MRTTRMTIACGLMLPVPLSAGCSSPSRTKAARTGVKVLGKVVDQVQMAETERKLIGRSV